MADPLVTLSEAKSYLRVEHDDEDDTITLLIAAASDAVRDVASGWPADEEDEEDEEEVPDRLKLAVLARVQVAFDNRGSIDAGTGELPMLTPLRTLEV